ncbi:MAG: glycosyltransferase [Acidimicrobiaceae bacterium]|nr:glycosyltransferase [Acidimicrobiaceae bacterium]
MRAAVIIPTYNEAENIERFLVALRIEAPSIDIIVVDDNSPDGTANFAETVGSRLGGIEVVRRRGVRGYAAATKDAMQIALDRGYQVIATMDADFSHDPKVLARLTALVTGDVSVAIGSRYAPGGVITNWSTYRRLLSKWGNRYAVFALRLNFRDCTSGFRAYSSKSLTLVNLGELTADGYAFLTELAFVISTSQVGSIVEMPINYVDRAYGDSKMNTRIMRESMLLVTRWGIALRTGIGQKHLPR